MTENLQHRSVQVLQLVTVVMATVLVFMAEPTSAGFTRVCDKEVKSSQMQGLCGDELTKKIDSLCESRKQRSVGEQGEGDRKPDARLKSISLRSDIASSYLSKLTYYESNTVICECCVYKCQKSEMLEYCR